MNSQSLIAQMRRKLEEAQQLTRRVKYSEGLKVSNNNNLPFQSEQLTREAERASQQVGTLQARMSQMTVERQRGLERSESKY